MKKLIIVLAFLMVSGCFADTLSKDELQVIYTKRNVAYGKYVIRERDKAIAIAKEQAIKVEEEKENIDMIAKELEASLDMDDFLDILESRKNTYLNSIEDLAEPQKNELEDYFIKNTEPFKDRFATKQKEKIVAVEKKEVEEKKQQIISVPKETENVSSPTYINGILIVNKKYPLPTNYNPGEDPQAVAQVRLLIKAMQNGGYDINNSYSGFRSYSYQKDLYQRYVNRDGQQAADTYSARPGHSEHQTGLSYDLLHSNGSLVTKGPEVNWIADNARDYGFIIRYQRGKESITGYQAEPWHLRYIGEKAIEIHNSGLCLEEYLGVEGGDYK